MVGGVVGSVIAGRIGISSARMSLYLQYWRHVCPQLPVRFGAGLVVWRMGMSGQISALFPHKLGWRLSCSWRGKC